MLPNNLNIYITDADHVENFLDRNITHWFTFSHTGASSSADLTLFPKAEIISYNFHDAYDKEAHSDMLTWPNESHIKSIIEKANEIKILLQNGERVSILVNCAAGVSRSTAAAYIILNVIMGEWNERECWAQVQSRRPIAKPNPVMVSLADDLLDRKWKMNAPIRNVVSHLTDRGNSDCVLF